jgi:hypothetical protein
MNSPRDLQSWYNRSTPRIISRYLLISGPVPYRACCWDIQHATDSDSFRAESQVIFAHDFNIDDYGLCY